MLGSTKNQMGNTEIILPFNKPVRPPPLGYCVQFCSSHLRKDIAESVRGQDGQGRLRLLTLERK